jgi:hypothetical protein
VAGSLEDCVVSGMLEGGDPVVLEFGEVFGKVPTPRIRQCMCVCVCVRVRERGGEREKEEGRVRGGVKGEGEKLQCGGPDPYHTLQGYLAHCHRLRVLQYRDTSLTRNLHLP